MCVCVCVCVCVCICVCLQRGEGLSLFVVGTSGLDQGDEYFRFRERELWIERGGEVELVER